MCPTVQNHKSWRKGVKLCDGNDSISGGILKLWSLDHLAPKRNAFPCSILRLVAMVSGIYLYGHAYFHSTSPLRTAADYLQKESDDILWAKVSSQNQNL